MAGKSEEKPEKGHKEKAEKKAKDGKDKHGHAHEKGKEKLEHEKDSEEKPEYRKPGHEKERHGKEGHETEGREKEGREKKHRPRQKLKPKKGKSRLSLVELKPAEIVEAVVHLANEGHGPSDIGMILRDQYGVPKVGKAAGKKLGEILQEHKLLAPIPEDLMNLIRKSVALREHLARNKKDMSAKRGLMLTVSKIRALERYYKRRGKLPMQWRYSAETAALLAK